MTDRGISLKQNIIPNKIKLTNPKSRAQSSEIPHLPKPGAFREEKKQRHKI